MVALAGDSWLESRNEGDRARSALALLERELVVDSAQLDRERRHAGHDTVRATIWTTPADAEIPPDSASRLFVRLLLGSSYQPSRAAFESLVASDGIRYLGDAQFQSDLTAYYGERQPRLAQWFEWWGEHYMELLHKLRPHLSPAPTSIEEGMLSWAQIPLEVTTSWRQMRSDEELMSQIWNASIYQQNYQRFERRAREANAELLAQVRALQGSQ